MTQAGPEDLRAHAYLLVRAGYLDQPAVEAELAQAAAQDHGGVDPAVLRALTAQAYERARAEQQSWPPVSDHDRFESALDELRARGVVVLAYVDDHWAATDELERRDERGERASGVLWFTPPDVWHAVQHGMLEVNVWHGDSANAAPGDALLDEVLGVLGEHGLAAHFDEGRVEVACSWRRRV